MTELESLLKAFNLGSRVRVVGTDISALIESISYDIEGCRYRISYWHDNTRRQEWVYPSEIEKE